MFKGIIFDLDGVLCSTDQYHYQAWKQIADDIGVCFDENINNRLRGVSRMQSLEIILESAGRKYSSKEKNILTEKKNIIYKQLLHNMTSENLSLETRKTLEKLKNRGYKLAVGSSSKNAKLILRQLSLSAFFDAISDGTNISHSKPDPQVFTMAAEFMGLLPEECLVVEDAAAGIEAANAGGFASAGIGQAAGHPGVTYQLKNISGLLSILGCA